MIAFVGDDEAEPAGFGLYLCLVELDCPFTADEVHDDGDEGEEEQQVNQEAADVENKESAEPEQH